MAPLLVPDEPPADGAPADAGFFGDEATPPAAVDGTAAKHPPGTGEPPAADGPAADRSTTDDGFAAPEGSSGGEGADEDDSAMPDGSPGDGRADEMAADRTGAGVDGSASGGVTPATVAARLRQVSTDDTGPGRLRRSMDDALGADLGPGRLRRPAGSDTGWADEPAGRGPRRPGDDDLVPGRLYRSLDEALGDDFRPGRLRRSMDDALGDLGAGRLRRPGPDADPTTADPASEHPA
jgi:hypothetical protein